MQETTAKTLDDLVPGDNVVVITGHFTRRTQRGIVDRTTKLYTFIKGSDSKFRKSDGHAVGTEIGRGCITLVTPYFEAEWKKTELMNEFNWLITNPEKLSNSALREATIALLSEDLKREEYLTVVSGLVKTKNISNTTLENAIQKLRQREN